MKKLELIAKLQAIKGNPDTRVGRVKVVLEEGIYDE